VEHWHWLIEAQLLDAVAVGQVTPGPVFTTATFIGYVLHGGTGALFATLGIFLPSFVFVALSSRLIPRLRRSRSAGAFWDGVNVASLALMATVTWYTSDVARSWTSSRSPWQRWERCSCFDTGSTRPGWCSRVLLSALANGGCNDFAPVT
jgi:chromate transport protein ChrA